MGKLKNIMKTKAIAARNDRIIIYKDGTTQLLINTVEGQTITRFCLDGEWVEILQTQGNGRKGDEGVMGGSFERAKRAYQLGIF